MVLPKGSNTPLGDYFNSDEFDCKCSDSSCVITRIDIEHLEQLIQLREEIGPIKITSGYRCDSHNKKVGGSPKSQHKEGTATDIQSRRIKPRALAAFVKQNYVFGGIGAYDTFTHIDSRNGKARWGFNG